ncbi:MAG: flagellar hook-length control protein [Nitrospirae bacterium]|nr:MAG: flagellar hook-length control protein [Nitrospirota bacterium]
MTTVTVPVIAQSAAVQPGRLTSCVSAPDSFQSGRGFAEALQSVVQRFAGEIQQESSSGNIAMSLQMHLDAGENMPVQADTVTLSMIQQMLLNLPVAAQMTPAQIQPIAQDVLSLLSHSPVQNETVSRGQILETIVKSLQEMKKESAPEQFQKTFGNTVAVTDHALKSVQNAGTSGAADVSALKSPADSSHGTAKIFGAELFDALASTVNDREVPEVTLSTTRQSSAYVLHGGVHRLADASLGGDAGGDVSVTSIRDIHEPIRAAAETGVKQMILRLDPPGLGDVLIRLRVQQGVLTAELKVDSGSIKDLFTSVLPQIRQQLENSGIRVGELQVDLRDDYLADQGQRREQGQRQQQQQGRQTQENFFEYLA